MHPPRKWTEMWAREHPWLAAMMLLFWAVCMGFVVYILIWG